MKKVLLFAAMAVMALLPVQAQTIMKVGNHLGIDVNAGTTGIGFELSTPISQFIQARAGLSFMPNISFNIDSEVNGSNSQSYYEDVTLKNSIKRMQGSLIFNIYPGGKHLPLFIAVGGYFGGKELIKMNGKVSPSDGQTGDRFVEIGNYLLPVSPNGDINGSLRVKSFRPYFGIGTGRPCPGGRVSFMWEVGVQLQNTPKVYDGENRELQILELDNDDTYHKVMKYLKVYPVLRFTISGRIF